MNLDMVVCARWIFQKSSEKQALLVGRQELVSEVRAHRSNNLIANLLKEHNPFILW